VLGAENKYYSDYIAADHSRLAAIAELSNAHIIPEGGVPLTLLQFGRLEDAVRYWNETTVNARYLWLSAKNDNDLLEAQEAVEKARAELEIATAAWEDARSYKRVAAGQVMTRADFDERTRKECEQNFELEYALEKYETAQAMLKNAHESLCSIVDVHQIALSES